MARSFSELKEAYKISFHGMRDYTDGKWVNINPDDYDVIIESAGSIYAGKKYRIIKRPADITNDELCEICDRGGYNFGYRIEGSSLVVYID